jgi:hypothetical protein
VPEKAVLPGVRVDATDLWPLVFFLGADLNRIPELHVLVYDRVSS